MKLKRMMMLVLGLALVVGATPLGTGGAHASTAATRGAMSAYFKVVLDTINRVGIMNEKELWGARGVVYADLVDFNKDGVSELFLFYLENEQHVEEVWSFSNNKVQKIHSFSLSASGGRVDDMSVSIATTKNKAYIVHQSGYSATGFNDDFEYMNSNVRTFHTMVGGKFAEVDWLEIRYEELASGKTRTVYNQKLNGKEKKITAAAFNQGMAKHNFEKRKVILGSDGTGYKWIEADTSNNGKKLLDLALKLKTGMRSTALKNTYGQLKAAEKNELTAFLKFFSPVSSMTTNKSYSNAQIANYLVDGIHNGAFAGEKNFVKAPSVEPIVKDQTFYYYPYAKSKVDQLTKKLFGRTLPAKDYESVKYKNGHFYILSPEFGSDPSVYSPQVNSFYSLGSGLYYVEFVDFAFDWEYSDSFINSDKLSKSMDTWTAAEKAKAYESLQYGIHTGYAVLKQVTTGGKKSWNLVQYSSENKVLTEKEIAAFKNK